MTGVTVNRTITLENIPGSSGDVIIVAKPDGTITIAGTVLSSIADTYTIGTSVIRVIGAGSIVVSILPDGVSTQQSIYDILI
jgi:hypothetical protein